MSEIPIVQCKCCKKYFKENEINIFRAGLQTNYICRSCYDKTMQSYLAELKLFRENKNKNKNSKRYKRRYFESGSLSGMMQTLNKYHSTSKVVAIFKDDEKYIAITETEIKESENEWIKRRYIKWIKRKYNDGN